MTAGLRWRGNGEISAALFKRVINHKAQQRIIPAIKHPVIGIPCEESSQYYNKGFNASIKIYTPPLPLTPAILNSSPNRRRLSRWWTKFFSLQQLRSLMGYHCQLAVRVSNDAFEHRIYSPFWLGKCTYDAPPEKGRHHSFAKLTAHSFDRCKCQNLYPSPQSQINAPHEQIYKYYPNGIHV
ncbi:hypothetical protein G6F42_017556 [Rhizopus arrhizus]|nr:hypothetical protein G6F42_017556 [Rhizopus arrhizus]